MSSYGILAVGFASGVPCPHANQWLKSFDHDACEGFGYGEFTYDPTQALCFTDKGDALAFWNRQSKVKPLRPDGLPNKPLTALTVIIEQLT